MCSVSDLTTAEKIDLVRGMGSWHTNDLAGKLKSIHMSDGPHGLRAQAEDAKSNNDSIIATCFPTASALACSFDVDLIREVAGAIAEEASEANVSVILGPGVNMKRSPLCGRNFEYFSEDPYLAGELATEYVNGIQSKGVGTSLKHFAGNNQETHRMTANSVIDERTLREIYLRAFEKVVKNANPATIMASYNLINGKPACENNNLLTDILRNEWNYEGLVMSDWGACVDAATCIQAGMDMEMPDSSGNHTKDILAALNAGELSEEALNRAAGRVLDLVDKYPAKDDLGLKKLSNDTLNNNYELAVSASERSAVLLKNENMLPLDECEQIIVVGDLASKMRIQGGGSSHINTGMVRNIIQELEACGKKVLFLRGYDADSKEIDTVSKKDSKLISEAVKQIEILRKENNSIPIVICGGLTDRAEGEGYDRTSFELPANQRELYEKIKNIAEDVTYVTFGGSPYNMSDIAYAKAILSMYLGGCGVAKACVNILLGKANPSGRLAETWPAAVEDTPCYSRFGRQNPALDDVLYTESIFIGYRYYDSFDVPVKFPFGYGLSYTEYEYNNLSVSRNNDRYVVSVDVTNIGSREGYETVLVFVKNPEGDCIRSDRELRGIAKCKLVPGETKTVSIDLDDRTFEIYDVEQGKFITAGGEYKIEISKSVGDVILSESISIDAPKPVSQRELYPSYFVDIIENNGIDSRFAEEEFRKLYAEDIPDFSNVAPGEFSAKNSISQMAPYSLGARCLLKIGKIAARIMTGSPLSDPEARMIYEGIAEGNIDSVCNQSGGIISHKIIEKIIESANSSGRR